MLHVICPISRGKHSRTDILIPSTIRSVADTVTQQLALAAKDPKLRCRLLMSNIYCTNHQPQAFSHIAYDRTCA